MWKNDSCPPKCSQINIQITLFLKLYIYLTCTLLKNVHWKNVHSSPNQPMDKTLWLWILFIFGSVHKMKNTKFFKHLYPCCEWLNISQFLLKLDKCWHRKYFFYMITLGLHYEKWQWFCGNEAEYNFISRKN